ncbi:MAG: uridine kinase [SAR324 cluster bacterium]|mgnify:FL=1|jgi:uridine kinase|nr:uridine kinase [SAR324 cluster bacterium]MCH2265333.1 uridine kinase [SAR324 cluster bacterium]
MKIIAVAGGSGCGKTLFTALMVERLPNTAVLPLDSYYYDRPDHIPSDQYDYDGPQAFDFELFQQHLAQLSSGEAVQKPHFAYESGKREAEFTELVPEKYLIIEGLHVLLRPNIRKMLGFSFYLESPLDVAVSRRCLRDIKDYEVTAEYSLNQYLKFVRPVFFEQILPTKQYADLVVENSYETRLDFFIDNYLAENQL